MTIKTNPQMDARMASPRACLAILVLDTVRGTSAFLGRMRDALKSRFQASSAVRTVRPGSLRRGQHDEHLPIFRSQRHRLPPRQRNSVAVLR